MDINASKPECNLAPIAPRVVNHRRPVKTLASDLATSLVANLLDVITPTNETIGFTAMLLDIAHVVGLTNADLFADVPPLEFQVAVVQLASEFTPIEVLQVWSDLVLYRPLSDLRKNLSLDLIYGDFEEELAYRRESTADRACRRWK